MTRPKGINFLDIRLVDRVGIDKEGRLTLVEGINKLFLLVTKEYCRLYPDAQFPLVSATFHANDLRPHDLRCFILPSKKESVVRRVAGSKGRLGDGGTTAPTSKGTVSEVYDDSVSTYELEVKLIFHELMHNKLNMDDRMHTHPDVGFGLASFEVNETSMFNRSTSNLNYENAKFMAQHLFDEVRQYAGG